MTRTDRIVYANGNKVRERILDMRISERELARRTGLGDATVRAILHRNELSRSTQIADIYRALTELGLNPGQLLDPPPPDEPDDTSDDDIHTLAGLLLCERTMHKPDRLAVALQWELDRLRAALTALDARLRNTGLRVHENSMGITIRPLDDRADKARQRLAELRDDDEGIHQGTARVLYAIYTGNISTRETRNDHQVQLGALKNRGAITFGTGTGNRFTLSGDVAYAFDVP
jgi:transcriptional regulator with XRE-family HTH domain